MVNYYIPDENDKKRYNDEIAQVAQFLNRKPDRQGSNQDLEKIVNDGKTNEKSN